MVLAFCRDAHAYLTADKKNVIAVHCKAGKGRTGALRFAALGAKTAHTVGHTTQYCRTIKCSTNSTTNSATLFSAFF